MRKNAIILCSGGLDSVVTAYYVKKRLEYKNLTIIFFNYKQKAAAAERHSAKLCAHSLNATFLEIKLPELVKFSTSLINKKGKAKRMNFKDLTNTKKESEKWYVPFRNTIFISYALAYAESLYLKKGEVNDIFLGFKCEGKESYPDTTLYFINIINKLSKQASVYPFLIKAPLIKKDKEDIVMLGQKLGVKLDKTFSCYVNGKVHCGCCLACTLRKSGFYWANVKDNTHYENI